MNATAQSERERKRSTLVLPDWMEAGTLSAVVVAVVFFARDAFIGAPLHTPSVLGTLLLEGAEAARSTTGATGAAVLYNAVHFVLWIVFGLVATQAMRRAEADPKQRWLPIAVGIFALVSFFGLDAVVSQSALTRIHLWVGGTAGLATMAGFLSWRYPGAFGR